ncbi:DUF2460 domain-containing protein [Paraurantiacibacter namhicola]|uniref:TIGR02217 family protein n=1 Tax=Paraurantiacibacter namhicola TaxID=645517 RepID=A0A1C7D5J8_9SPHN|nr:DUF2460 domain-containing protein [Paraurantiacibacter namhicola]ANU06601.1 hypothetical protein A6F65_00274 [Paraurantiacibacter namhicola]
MAFWLADKREGQDTDFIQRFDPHYWTVDFPRPMMASAVSAGPADLQVDLVFHRKSDLCGLIWASEDAWDHPLLGYDTDRDYARTTLRFDWRSSGDMMPLDAVNGPTLTIEGRDAAGQQRSWYVRLWNYAIGSPTDARIELPFSSLSGGWDISENPDPVWPSDIDRMFISLVPTSYAAGDDTLLPTPAQAQVTLANIACEGERAMLVIGDAILPAHGVQMATAYDDSYNLNPARVLRNCRQLGYRGRICHYVGMSHFMALADRGDVVLEVAQPAELCTPAERWHASFFAACAAADFQPIVSLSYELFAEICPDTWQQRAHDGTPGRTGWVPPSALLSPASSDAMDWLQAAARAFTALQLAAGLPVLFQVGEPWWWTPADGAICLYDDAARAALGGNPPVITDMRAPLDQAQLDLLDAAGALLAASTIALADAVRAEAGAAGAETMLLAFTPTILAEDMPELRRANLPTGWAWPAFDRLQLEDYDWLTAGAEALRKAAYRTVDERLGYPRERQDYLSGFVLRPEDAAAFWPRIDAGLDEAASRGIEHLYVWALPQVCRDGYLRLPASKDDDMQAFDDVPYPLALGRDTMTSPEFVTNVSVTASGHERRSSQWADARTRYDVGPGIRSEAEMAVLLQFFRARRGAARGFRLSDPFDHSSNGMTGTPTHTDQPIGTGDGLTASFPLVKSYGDGEEPQVRRITRPVAGSVRVAIDGEPAAGWALQDGGVIAFETAPPDGAAITAGFLFDVPVRFAEDRLDLSALAFRAGEVPSIPLVELREAV